MHIADDHSRWNDDLAAYAIGALDADAMAGFAKHVSECDSCRAELHRLAPAVDLLSGTVEQLEPPSGLKGRIMADVEADLAGASSSAATRRRRARPAWARRPWLAVASAAAVAAAFALGIVVAGGGESGGGATTVPVQALAPASAEQVSGALVGDGSDWRLDVDRLPALRGDRVYQAWVMRAGAVSPSTVFVLSRDGRASVAIPEPLRDGDQVLVTAEPRGGSATPTTRPLLSASV